MYGHNNRRQRHGGSSSRNVDSPLKVIDGAVVKAHTDLIAAGESVSAWKVGQSALVILKAVSFESLGFSMQNVPSLFRIMITEAKVNSFIHCFVGVQKITSLHDLEIALCESEGIESFEKLQLGPILKHPLVVHYFSLGPDTTEIFKITCEQVVSHLSILLRKRKKIWDITVDDLLDHIAKKKMQSRENLCIRIQSLGMHIGNIMRGRRSEFTLLKKCSDGLDVKAIFDDNEDDGGNTQQDEDNDKNNGVQEPVALSEAIHANKYCTKYAIHRAPKNLMIGINLKPELQSGGVEEGFIGDNVVDGHTWRFIKNWKDTCDKENVIESFSKMLDFYFGPMKPKKKIKALNKVTTSYPNVGLLNVAIASIKFGLWDRMSSAPQANSKEVLEKEVLVASKNVLEDCSSTFNETKRCNDRVRSFQGKQVSEINFCTKIAIHKTPKMWMVGIKFKPEFQSVDVETGFIDDNAVDGYTWRFIKIWKDTSEKENVVEAFGKMLDFYHGQMKPKKKAKALNQMITSYPYVGLLNVAIASIKFGLWDRMSTIPKANREVLSNTNDRTCAADANMDVELAEKDVIVANKDECRGEFQSSGVEEGFIGNNVVDGHTWRFIKIWKDTCDKENVIESFSKMLDFYLGPVKPKKKNKALNKVITSYPNVGLLNVAIASIKFGLWDCMSSAPQANSEEVLENTISATCALDVNVVADLAEKEVLVASKNVLEDCSSTFNETKRCNDRVVSFQGKQVSEISFCTKIAIHRTPKMWMAGIKFKPEFQSVDVETGFIDDNAVDGYTWRFIKIWKETSEKENVVEAFGKMLDFYHGQMKPKKKAKALNQMITSYPYVGLLNVAIASIKFGLWDRMSTIPQANREVLSNTNDRTCAADANMDVELAEKDVIVANKDECRGGIALEDVLQHVKTYFMAPNHALDNINSYAKKQLVLLREVYKLECSLTQRFSVNDFETLGFGDLFTFLAERISLLPTAWRICLGTDEKTERPSVRVCMSQRYLLKFLSEAANSLEENELLSKPRVSELLRMQFPSAGLTLVEDDFTADLLTTMSKNGDKESSNVVLFSANLSDFREERCFSDTHVGTNDAIKLLLGAPMLVDLTSWSYWDYKFAPSLGPLVEWLLSDLITKELLCLVTKDGKVLRIDHSATVDSFLEAFLRGSSFETAVQLLSLIALYGGERNVPLSLLKCHAKNAFEVMLNVSSKNYVESVPVASRFVLDCLCSLPREFRSFAAEFLVSAFRSIIKDATMVILSECKSKDDHLMIHELGLLLGIVEWFDNDCSYLSDSKNSLQNHRFSFKNEVIQFLEVNQPSDDCERDRVMNHSVDDSCIRPMLDSESEYNAANIIKSIRMEEFGLDPNISITESRVLKKQHARLGRALHCLSEELYSQDSHFLLELVQNADDNVYPRNVEPTLTFILQEKIIVVLNNENGFSAENIRALCDVGNSTKKKSSAGYIGKKGIGFKSVFRVTDAPEIHSNGFHIKFDLTEGQIGFVLPTIVPPCDIDLFSNLVSSNITDQVNQQNYNTCIVLPLKSKLTETSTLENIISMFSDLHPSLLLFLHRLECIKFRNMINNSFAIMRKEVVGNGLTNVYTGSKTLTWFVESRKLQTNGIRNDVKTTEISVAFALDLSNNGIYSPILDQQYVFAFLPLRTYGLKFIIQGDFILPSSREEVDGDSPWNQWLLSEFPSLFVNSEKSFCNLPSFKDCLGKGVSAFMSYVPLVGEVHGFFAMLPRMIMSKLCTSNCLLLEGENDKWVPPCSVLRNWNEQVRTLLPDSLIQKHLGLGYLNKEIILPDSLARALGIKNYGPQILVHMLSSLCCTKDGLTSMGLNWLSSWLTELYSVSLQNSVDFKAGSDILNTLRKTPFIPLLNGSYGSVEEGMIWMNLDGSWRSLKAFTRLFANLRIVDPALFDGSITENLIQMLSKVGVQQLSAHQVVKSHILLAICDKKNTVNNNLMREYLSFIMVHLQSSCSDCCNERGHIISEVYNKAFILTNHGFVLPFEVPIHFNNDFGNHIDMGRLINGIDVKWYEVDKSYLKYPAGKSMHKWRKFLKDLGVTDFVQTVQVEKTVPFSSQFILTNMMWQKVIIPPGSTVSDWESRELVDLLVNVSLSGDFEKCKYLLEVLDKKWNAYFSDKGVAYCNLDGESKSFKSSLVSALNDVRWVASSLDNGFHYPKDLYHDCETVRLILGDNAPYAVPKILSEKLISSIGFKRTVTLDGALSVLEIWKKSATSFKASVSQMSRFYSFLWNELASSTKNSMPDLLSGAFIFVPLSSASSSEVVPGVLLSPEEVYWHDTMISSQCEFSKMLSNLYPSLHDFFVNKCGVKEKPPLLDFLSFLSHLSTVDTPTKAAKKVFDVFVMWSDGFKSGDLSFEDVEVLKKNLEEKEMKVLPTAQDEWVSLHPSFGLVCWCDDGKLADEFEELNNINFFSLCELTDEEKVILKVKVSAFMKMLGIPALSEIVTREAIHYGPADNSYQTSLVSWVLPYAQRYISNSYRERYLQLKLSGFEQLKRLHIVVVEKLFYKNVIPRSKLASKKRHDISCLLQDEILYTTHESDSHTIFMEFSRFLINGNTELHLANFLHMLTTMTESGSTEEQIEAFILNNQKVPKLLDEEPVWSIQSNKNWPPSSWKTAPKFTSSCVNDPKLQDVVKFDLNTCSIEENVISTDQIDNLQSSTSSNNEGHGAKMILNVEPGLVDQDDSPGFSQKDRLSHGTANVQQAFLTGRRGEELAFYYYSNRVGIKGVKWVNEVSETGLPYDIEVYDDNNRKEYIEVKTTKSARKDWFEISAKEWQFAVKSGESFSIARVVLSGDNAAKVSILNDPARLCRIGQLKLALLMSKELEKDEFVIF